MLILTRKLGESITIGDDIKVSVLGIRGRQVRIGIEAPDKLEVHREEIYRKIQAGEPRPASPNTGGIAEMVRTLKKKITGNGSSTTPSS